MRRAKRMFDALGLAQTRVKLNTSHQALSQ